MPRGCWESFSISKSPHLLKTNQPPSNTKSGVDKSPMYAGLHNCLPHTSSPGSLFFQPLTPIFKYLLYREASARSKDNCPQSTDEQTEGGSHTADEARCHFGVPLLSRSHYWKDGIQKKLFSKSCPFPLSLCTRGWGIHGLYSLSVQLSDYLSSHQIHAPPVHTLPRHSNPILPSPPES